VYYLHLVHVDIEIVDDIRRKNEELLDKILQRCERSDREGPEVIMLIGRSGAGKSALINTIHQVITGEYYKIAKHGSGHAKSVTLDLGRYLKYNITRDRCLMRWMHFFG
jgi:predicted GTPase